MQATALSVALVGLDPHLIHVEVDSGRGVSIFRMVGLAETTVRESHARIRAALSRLEVDLNEYNITVNLAPADLRKHGSCFDLAIAMAILGALEKVDTTELASTVLLGELALSGDIRPVRGVLPSLLGAVRRGQSGAIVPVDNASEAAVVTGLDCHVAESILQVVEHLNGKSTLPRATGSARATSTEGPPPVDLSEIRGQQSGRRALEVAAAGGHNLLMVGPPGAGKTMLARRLPTILPPMTSEESLEVTAVHSVAGLIHRQDGLLQTRPFRAPHHSISAPALLGGGSPLRPGEVSLAHNGCLFLDELLEFPRHVVEGLRQPLEDGTITICRARARAEFPSRVVLVAAVNPCPCGHDGDSHRRCTCSEQRIRTYRSRLSGPLLDRIDLHLVLKPVPLTELHRRAAGERSKVVAERVVAVREIQAERRRRGIVSAAVNADLSGKELDQVAKPDEDSVKLLRDAVDSMGLSARGYAKVRRVARTIADLEGSDAVKAIHLAEALHARFLDRQGEPVESSAAA